MIDIDAIRAELDELNRNLKLGYRANERAYVVAGILLTEVERLRKVIAEYLL